MNYEDVTKKRCVRKQILLTNEDAYKLKIVSDATFCSQNEIINKALSAYLKRYKRLFEPVIYSDTDSTK